MKIHKQILSWTDQYQTVTLPKYARILSVQVQHNQVVMWYAFVGLEDDTAPRQIWRVLTGNDTPMPYHGATHFLGTVQLDGGTFVAHYFEVRP